MSEREDQVPGIRQRMEVVLHVANDLNVLAKLFGCLAAQLQTIDAWRFYSDHGRAAILLVTGPGSRVPQALRVGGFECETNPVLVVEQEHRGVSAIRLSTELRAHGIQILDAYACGSPQNGTALVLKTTDCAQAAAVLEAMDLLSTQAQGSYRDSEADAEQVEVALK